MAEETLNTSEEETGQQTNTSTEETQESEGSGEGTAEEQHVEAGVGEETEETSVNWQKRYQDLQAETTRLQQKVAEVDKTKQQQTTQQDWQKYQEERNKRLDVGSYMEKFKENPAQGLNEWAKAREAEMSRSLHGMVGPITSQTQLTGWRLMKILNEVAPEVVEKHLEKEKAIKKVLNEVPALYNYPDYLDQAEKMVLAGAKGKDLKKMQTDIEKKVKKSMEQRSGTSIPATKAPGGAAKTKEERYKDYIVGKGRRSTIL